MTDLGAPETTSEGSTRYQSDRRRWMSPRTKTVLQIAISVILLGAIIWFIFQQFSNFSDVLAVIRTLTWGESLVLGLAAIWNLLTYWFVVVVATPGLTVPQAAVLTQSTTAVSNAVPAGGAVAVGLTYSMMSSWGFSRSRTTLSVVVTGIWNNFVKLGMPIAALAILALQGQPGAGRIVAAVLGLAALVGAIVVFALILRSVDFARRAGLFAGRVASKVLALLKRPPTAGWDLAVVKWRGRVVGLVRHRWLSLTITTLISHLSLFGVLLISLRITDVSAAQVTWAEALAVFAFARLVTAIPLTPGGVGVVELALIAGLVQAGGNGTNVVAAVLLFRLLTYVLPIAVGALTYVYSKRNHSWRDSAPPLGDDGLAVNTRKPRHGPREEGPTAVSRRRVDIWYLVGALAVFILTAVLAGGGLSGWERSLFLAINGLPSGLMPVIWPFMQYGVFLTIPIFVAIALILRRFRLAASMAVAGVGVYFLAKLIKEFVQRGRPAALIEGVIDREMFAVGSLGYPSGHAAVAGALTVVVTPYLSGRWKIVPAALLVIVGVGRMFVAAHVPLDLIGGAALGVAAGAIANLAIGAPTRRRAARVEPVPAPVTERSA
jgi:putative heme transporter